MIFLPGLDLDLQSHKSVRMNVTDQSYCALTGCMGHPQGQQGRGSAGEASKGEHIPAAVDYCWRRQIAAWRPATRPVWRVWQRYSLGKRRQRSEQLV
jgi:hypothetical protein